jgi:hypothetical protein
MDEGAAGYTENPKSKIHEPNSKFQMALGSWNLVLGISVLGIGSWNLYAMCDFGTGRQ